MVETFFRNFLWLDDTDVQKKPLLFNCNVAKDFDELSWLISLINGRNTVTNIFFSQTVLDSLNIMVSCLIFLLTERAGVSDLALSLPVLGSKNS